MPWHILARIAFERTRFMSEDTLRRENGKTASPAPRLPLGQRWRYRLGQTGLRAPLVRWQHRGVRPTDVFIGAYPRSGCTWLRFMLFEIIMGRGAQFTEVDAMLPPVGRHAQAATPLPNNGRLMVTHEIYRRVYRKAIYITRDARDVAVSEFMREKAKGVVQTFDAYLTDFVAGKKRHGSWTKHLSSWLDSDIARQGNLIAIKYEDMHACPFETLVAVTKFLGLEADPERITNAIRSNTMKHMQKKEDVAQGEYGGNLVLTFSGQGENGRFVRKGEVGGWRSQLTKEQASRIELHEATGLVRMGYSRSCLPPASGA
jgi:hypothetical protein